jgi:hypothetical protein
VPKNTGSSIKRAHHKVHKALASTTRPPAFTGGLHPCQIVPGLGVLMIELALGGDGLTYEVAHPLGRAWSGVRQAGADEEGFANLHFEESENEKVSCYLSCSRLGNRRLEEDRTQAEKGS